MQRGNRHFWYCNVCHNQNSRLDGECQYCDCQGTLCKRDNCSGNPLCHMPVYVIEQGKFTETTRKQIPA